MAELITKQPLAESFVYGSTDLNDITTLCYGVIGSSNSNNPIGGYGLFVCINIPFGNITSMCIQFVFEWNQSASEKAYRRIKWNGEWRSWVEL